MNDNEEVCSCCGQTMNRYMMVRITTGRKTHWFCRECYKTGERQADYITHRHDRFANKMTRKDGR